MKDGFVFNNANIHTPTEIIIGASLFVESGVIQEISRVPIKNQYPTIDCKGKWLLPGLIDIHVNGGGGGMSIDGNTASIEKIVKAHSRYGTTGMLITTISVEDKLLEDSVTSIAQVAQMGIIGSKIIGIHLEGPFLNPEKRGAHQKQFLKKPDIELFNRIYELSNHSIKILSLAPELEGAMEVITEVSNNGIVVGLAHSEATYSITMSAIKAGVSLCTHLFNGMMPLSHKEPGPIGAFLTSSNTYVELIPDGIHVAPSVMEIVFKVKNSQEIILVTDAVTPAGTDMDRFTILGAELESRNNSCFVPGTNNLAGSALTMNKAVKLFKENTSCTVIEALNMASLNPARLLKIDDKKGSIETGKDADLIITDENLSVLLTMVEGKIVFKE